MADEAFRIDVVWTWTLTSRAPKWCCKPKSCQSIYIWVECCCSLHNPDNKSCLLTFKWTFRFEIRVAKTEPLLFLKRVEITSFRMIGKAAKMTLEIRITPEQLSAEERLQSADHLKGKFKNVNVPVSRWLFYRGIKFHAISPSLYHLSALHHNHLQPKPLIGSEETWDRPHEIIAVYPDPQVLC